MLKGNSLQILHAQHTRILLYVNSGIALPKDSSKLSIRTNMKRRNSSTVYNKLKTSTRVNIEYKFMMKFSNKLMKACRKVWIKQNNRTIVNANPDNLLSVTIEDQLDRIIIRYQKKNVSTSTSKRKPISRNRIHSISTIWFHITTSVTLSWREYKLNLYCISRVITNILRILICKDTV